MGSDIVPQSSEMFKYEQALMGNILSDSAESHFGVSTGQWVFPIALMPCVLQGKDVTYVTWAVLSYLFSGPEIKAQSILFNNTAVTMKTCHL